MTEYWQISKVAGIRDDGHHAEEEVLHRRGHDPIVLACRRNNRLAGMTTIIVETDEVFMQIREEDGQKRRAEIPRDERTAEEWDW